ncbi:MAG: ABC transporter permease [Candidatus Margulisbacteria bacterium]|jgi:ABC-2 type transport system permease protein|nr:ABC transporter permease [Candidatus Margulisiibacteriota bacterium]
MFWPRLAPIIRKEFTHLWRDPLTLAMMVALPVLMLIMYGYAASFDVRNVPLGVYDQSRTAESRQFIERFTSSGYFQLVEEFRSSDQFQDRMDAGRVRVIIDIPPDYARNLSTGKQAQIQVLVDGSDPTWASSAIGYVSGIFQTYYQDRLAILFQRRGMAKAANNPIDLAARLWYNPDLKSVNFYIPGLIAVIMMQISASLTSLAIVNEKEQGTMESLIVSPVRKNELMLGKVLPYVIVAFLDVIVVTIVGFLLFGVPVKGSYLLLLLCSFIYLLGAMGFGILISTGARTSQEAMQMATLTTMLPSILLSGFIYPVSNMPWPLQAISLLIPARYFIDIIRAIYLKGVGLECFWQPFALLTALTVFNLYASVRSFKKRLD